MDNTHLDALTLMNNIMDNTHLDIAGPNSFEKLARLSRFPRSQSHEQTRVRAHTGRRTPKVTFTHSLSTKAS